MSFLRHSIHLKFMPTKCVLETKFINRENLLVLEITHEVILYIGLAAKLVGST